MNMLNNNITRCFNAGAKTYESAADVQTEVAKRLAKKFSAIPENTIHRILEIGSGTGLLSQYLIKFFPLASLLLTDIAPNMVNICRERFSHAAVQCLDGEQITQLDKFDLIASSMTLHWFSDIQSGLQKMINALKPHGYLVFAFLGENSLCEWKNKCKELNIAIGTPVFPSSHAIQTFYPEIQIKTEIIQQSYQSARHFFSVLKKLGAIATRADYKSLPAGELRRVMRHFEQEMQVTYEIIYGYYIKS